MLTRCVALAIAFAVIATTICSRAEDYTIVLEIGAKGRTLMLDRPFKAVLIGDPNVVDVLTQADRWAILQPVNVGATNVIFIDERNIAIANFRVVVCKAGAKGLPLNQPANCAHST